MLSLVVRELNKMERRILRNLIKKMKNNKMVDLVQIKKKIKENS
jgi:hypothetical protein